MLSHIDHVTWIKNMTVEPGDKESSSEEIEIAIKMFKS